MRLVRTTRITIDVSGGTATLADGCMLELGAVCVAVVRGADVSVRGISDRDPVLGRIMRNDGLLRTRYADRVCYVAKDPVLALASTLDGIHVAGFVVGDGGADVEEAVGSEERRIVSLEGIRGNRPLQRAACGQWFRRLKMPLLLAYLCVLLLNFFCYQSVGRRYEERRRLVEASERRSRTETEVSGRQRKMIGDFLRSSSGRSAFSFDRIAASVPGDVRLTLLSLGGDGSFRIKGETADASSVTVFAENLGKCFGRLRIRSIGRIPGREIYGFELEVRP